MKKILDFQFIGIWFNSFLWKNTNANVQCWWKHICGHLKWNLWKSLHSIYCACICKFSLYKVKCLQADLFLPLVLLLKIAANHQWTNNLHCLHIWNWKFFWKKKCSTILLDLKHKIKIYYNFKQQMPRSHYIKCCHVFNEELRKSFWYSTKWSHSNHQ